MYFRLNRFFHPVLYGGFSMLLFGMTASAQHGTAPPSFYPLGYNGETFTGTVLQTTDDTITLTYTHGNKSATFEGYASALCNLPVTKTATGPMPLSQVQTGTVVTVFYEPKTIKVDGRKQQKNEVIAISFQQVTSKPVVEEHRGIFYCLPPTVKTFFKAFNQ